MLVALTTGCRPKEAAYIVFHKSIRENNYIVKHKVYNYQAHAPGSETKTGHEYLWPLPRDFDPVVQQINGQVSTGFAKYEKLWHSLEPFYKQMVLKKAVGVAKRHNDRQWYCMRTARAYHATEWIKEVHEYRYMKWKPEPLNPLQHESEKMTREHYASKDIVTKWNTQSRCVDKYYGDPNKRQGWMAEFLEKQARSVR